MLRKYVINALADFYKLTTPSVEKLEQCYQSNKKKLPDLNLDEVFKALNQSSLKLSATGDGNLYLVLGNLIADFNLEEEERKSKGEKLPPYLAKFRDEMQKQVAKYEDQPAVAPSLTG